MFVIVISGYQAAARRTQVIRKPVVRHRDHLVRGIDNATTRPIGSYPLQLFSKSKISALSQNCGLEYSGGDTIQADH